MLRVRVALAGRAAEVAGVRELTLNLPGGATAREALEELIGLYPSLGWLELTRPAVNLEYTTWDQALADGDEVAFIPPVSGGAERAFLTRDPLDPAPLAALVDAPEHGAVTIFSGNVRNHARGHVTAAIEYDAYEPMAARELGAVVAEAEERFPEARVVVAHRLGLLKVGEASVVVAAGSAHRDVAFAACRWTIDALKERVPIWKREIGPDGAVWIEGDARVSATDAPREGETGT